MFVVYFMLLILTIVVLLSISVGEMVWNNIKRKKGILHTKDGRGWCLFI